MINVVLQIVLMTLPWPLRRQMLIRIFGFQIGDDVKIGYSIIHAQRVVIKNGVRIGHLNFVRNLSYLIVEEYVIVGNLNWVSCTKADDPDHYTKNSSRVPGLTIRRHASISSRHHLDCTDQIEIGEFAVIGGVNTQILTHGIDVRSNTQMAGPVSIGAYCFVGTRSTFLRDTALPSHCVLAAGSVVAKALKERFRLYAGVPARKVRNLPEESSFFERDTGFVA